MLGLFNYCLELTRMKIASDLIHPVPQVGPLVMDVIEQRNTVIEQVRKNNNGAFSGLKGPAAKADARLIGQITVVGWY